MTSGMLSQFLKLLLISLVFDISDCYRTSYSYKYGDQYEHPGVNLNGGRSVYDSSGFGYDVDDEEYGWGSGDDEDGSGGSGYDEDGSGGSGYGIDDDDLKISTNVYWKPITAAPTTTTNLYLHTTTAIPHVDTTTSKSYFDTTTSSSNVDITTPNPSVYSTTQDSFIINENNLTQDYIVPGSITGSMDMSEYLKSAVSRMKLDLVEAIELLFKNENSLLKMKMLDCNDMSYDMIKSISHEEADLIIIKPCIHNSKLDEHIPPKQLPVTTKYETTSYSDATTTSTTTYTTTPTTTSTSPETTTKLTYTTAETPTTTIPYFLTSKLPLHPNVLEHTTSKPTTTTQATSTEDFWIHKLHLDNRGDDEDYWLNGSGSGSGSGSGDYDWIDDLDGYSGSGDAMLGDVGGISDIEDLEAFLKTVREMEDKFNIGNRESSDGDFTFEDLKLI